MAHSKAHRKAISEGLKRYHANKKGKKWIKDAIKHPGALTRKAKRLGLTTKSGKLKSGAITKLEKSKNPTTRKEAYLAETLGKMRKRKKA